MNHSFATAIGLSTDCKWVFDETCPTLCDEVVHFEVKRTPFGGTIVLNVLGQWPICHVGVWNDAGSSSKVILYALSKTRSQLGRNCKA